MQRRRNLYIPEYKPSPNLIIYYIDIGGCHRTLYGHGTLRAQFNESTICGGDEGGIIKLWDLRTGGIFSSKRASHKPLTSLVSSSHGRFMVGSGGGELIEIDPSDVTDVTTNLTIARPSLGGITSILSMTAAVDPGRARCWAGFAGGTVEAVECHGAIL